MVILASNHIEQMRFFLTSALKGDWVAFSHAERQLGWREGQALAAALCLSDPQVGSTLNGFLSDSISPKKLRALTQRCAQRLLSDSATCEGFTQGSNRCDAASSISALCSLMLPQLLPTVCERLLQSARPAERPELALRCINGACSYHWPVRTENLRSFDCGITLERSMRCGPRVIEAVMDWQEYELRVGPSARETLRAALVEIQRTEIGSVSVSAAPTPARSARSL